MQGSRRIHTEPTVLEGGTVILHVNESVQEVHVLIPGKQSYTVPVVNGRAEFHVPPEVRGGTPLLITDGIIPHPAQVTVTVTGGQNR